jgi:NTP pyrophosphatase (non-canonical NTP hydrolase)
MKTFENITDRAGQYQELEVPLEGVLTILSSMLCHDMAMNGFWASKNTGEKIALMHSELSEALEADRKKILADDKIPAFSGMEAELADTVIRILDFAGFHKLRLSEAIIAKILFNLKRPYMHGKGY